MLTSNDVIKILKEKYSDLYYDEKSDLIYYNGISFEFEKLYKKILKANGMSFDCICDVHWENMSVIVCTECGTVIKYYYDECYEPYFRCPICTDYKTGYRYYTKEEIDSSEELQAIIKMYKDLSKSQKEISERREMRNGLNDWELCKPYKIEIGDTIYEFKLLIDSIINKNKLQGLRLEISKWKRSGELTRIFEYSKIIPLSRESYVYYKHILPELEKHTELNPIERLKGKSLLQSMEEEAVKRLKR